MFSLIDGLKFTSLEIGNFTGITTFRSVLHVIYLSQTIEIFTRAEYKNFCYIKLKFQCERFEINFYVLQYVMSLVFLWATDSVHSVTTFKGIYSILKEKLVYSLYQIRLQKWRMK